MSISFPYAPWCWYMYNDLPTKLGDFYGKCWQIFQHHVASRIGHQLHAESKIKTVEIEVGFSTGSFRITCELSSKQSEQVALRI